MTHMDESHFGFIVAAFAVAGGVMLVLSLWIAFDYRHVTQAISALEKSGVKRRGETGML